MSRANSLTTRIRFWIAERIEPTPPANESWCINCLVENGRTAVYTPDSMSFHVRSHPNEDEIIILGSYRIIDNLPKRSGE